MPKYRVPRLPPKPKDYKKFPWTETLRSVFPTEKASELLDKLRSNDDLFDYLFGELRVDYRKASLVVAALNNQSGIVRNDNEALLNVNIPFCEWRCFNCERSMFQLSKHNDIYTYYFEALMKEIKEICQFISDKCLIVKSINFSGNLLALEAREIEQLLKISTYSIGEVCVEIGNLRFVTEEKLALLKKYGVTRLLVLARTFNTVTLRKLCRRYELKDVMFAYKLIAQLGFELSIQLTVGLEGEKELQLGRNLSTAVELGASCIDIYSRDCPYNTVSPILTDDNEIARQRQLLEFSYEYLTKVGFTPYFLYCSEVEQGCFENVGYSMPGHKCSYLEDKSYQISSILGCGADAETIMVKHFNNTKRTFKNNPDIAQYVMGIDEILAKKKKFFK